MLEGFRWPLHPLDDLARITGSIAELLDECRVNDVQSALKVLPALNAQGQVWFVRARDAGQLAADLTRH